MDKFIQLLPSILVFVIFIAVGQIAIWAAKREYKKKKERKELHMSRTITVKHMMTDARDCKIEWDADFDKMTLSIRAGFISPDLLIHFLHILPEKDERFASASGIPAAVAICKRFDVSLELPSGAKFKMKSYVPPLARSPEIELFEIEKKE